MIKMQHENSTVSSITSFSSMKQTQAYRGNMNLSPICIPNAIRQLGKKPTSQITIRTN